MNSSILDRFDNILQYFMNGLIFLETRSVELGENTERQRRPDLVLEAWANRQKHYAKNVSRSLIGLATSTFLWRPGQSVVGGFGTTDSFVSGL
jgi:hypothetical protein